MLFEILVVSWLLGLFKMFMEKIPASSAATKLTEAKTKIAARARIMRFFLKVFTLGLNLVGAKSRLITFRKNCVESELCKD